MENLWRIPDVSTIRTPIGMLREQAENLSNATDGALLGAVDTVGSGNELSYDLKVVVPSLNRYMVGIIRYSQKITSLYEGTMYSYLQGKPFRIESEQAFDDTLRSIITSDDVTKVITSLLAQARS